MSLFLILCSCSCFASMAPLLDSQHQELTPPLRSMCLWLLVFLLGSLRAQLVRSKLGVSFEFPTITENTNGLTFLGAAGRSADGIQLTANQKDISDKHSSGRSFYEFSIPLWSKSTKHITSFNTSFRLQIKNASSVSYGDGLTFLLAPDSTFLPPNSTGQWLGLFNSTIDGSVSNHIVAIEFDTFRNQFDPDGNHVGINVNGIISVANASLHANSAECPINLKNGSIVTAWIDYSGQQKLLQIFVSYSDIVKPEKPVLSHGIDLSEYLPEEVFVGFSGATGDSSEIHKIISWNFTSTSVGNPFSGSLRVGALVGSLLFMVVALASAIFSYVAWQKWRRQGYVLRSSLSYKSWRGISPVGSQAGVMAGRYGPRVFSYKELSIATKHFSEKELLGRGGFGPVYRGVLPKEGTMIAVKCISKNSKQGEKEFMSEITIISKIRHRNLLQLQGWCHERGELLLIYDYMPNGSLDQYIFSKESEGEKILDWQRRYKIVCGLAAALLYLHEGWEQKVIHRDVKSSNVMLDADFNAKLGDFGLARLVEHDKIPETTIVAGTLGYLAPECTETGKATEESDVYSFGAVALEIACGRRPIDFSLREEEARLVDWVWSLYGEGRVMDAADPKLRGLFDKDQMYRLLIVGLACSNPHVKSRPTMREAYDSLIALHASLPCVPHSKPVSVYGSMPPVTIQALLSPLSTSQTSSTIPSSAIAPGSISEPLIVLSEPHLLISP